MPIVRWLIDHRIPASFFAPGQLAEGDPTARSVLGLVAAHPDLFTVGDGTWSGLDLTGLPGAADRRPAQSGRDGDLGHDRDDDQAALPPAGRRPERDASGRRPRRPGSRTPSCGTWTRTT